MMMMFMGGVVFLICLTELLYYSYRKKPTGREFLVPSRTQKG